MRLLPKKSVYKTLTFKLILGSQLIIIPLIFLLIFDHLYSINILHKKVSESKKDTLALYMNDIDSELKNVENYILNIISHDLSIPNLENDDLGTREIAKYNLKDNIVEGISTYNLIDGLIIYSNMTEDYLYSYNSRTSYRERIAVLEYISDAASEGESFASLGWFPSTIGSSAYMLRIMNVGSVYMGAWINVDTFIQYIHGLDVNHKDSVIFATFQGVPMNNADFVQQHDIDLSGDLSSYYFTGKDKSYMVIGQDSKRGNLRVTVIDTENNILEGLDSIQIVISVIALLSVLCIPLTFIILRKWIFKPVTKLKHAIKMLEGGDLSHNIKVEEHPYEFMLLIDTFNNFTSQIQQLKIEVYEEQIHKQKAELQYLQMQIKPHFYLNAFNTIYSMAQMKDYQLIQDMVRSLSDYLRYMVRGNFTLVPFEDELKHVQTYLQIQKIRSGENLICHIDADQQLMNLRMPPLILLTFIENIVKHALTMYEPITVFIKAALIKRDNGKYALITIQDSGKGFSAEALEQINSEHVYQKEDGESIGIWNIKQRLKLMYGNKAGITAANSGGACIEIILPIERGPIQNEDSNR
ncbi:sensor histidine kinase [Candidatus Pristimantibacillus sp. PTI5]|uniref:sensor histidine kinase n=1 Tax=Candidatus Pristimantibacillus sp. PTI5 TaxID=3400422 RepID=UPI003B0141D5